MEAVDRFWASRMIHVAQKYGGLDEDPGNTLQDKEIYVAVKKGDQANRNLDDDVEIK